MSDDWKLIIPPSMHSDFVRQVEDSVSAQLMEIFQNADDRAGDSLDEEELKAELTLSVISQYIALHRDGKWPAESCLQIGAKVVDQPGSHNWVCPSCRERNSNSFETCQKCSESRPESVSRTGPSTVAGMFERAPVSLPMVVGPLTWSCNDCGTEYPRTEQECSTCLEPLDPYKRHSWPPVNFIQDPNMRKDLRLRLFKAIRHEFGMDDPFSSSGLSHEEFINEVNQLKSRLLDMVRSDAVGNNNIEEGTVSPSFEVS